MTTSELADFINSVNEYLREKAAVMKK